MPNPSNIDDANLTALGFTTVDDDDKRVVRLIRLTAALVSSPTPQLLSNRTDFFVGPDDARYFSNGTALVAVGSGSSAADTITVTVPGASETTIGV